MSTLKKSLKLAGALAVVLGAASPLMATSADAAPYYGHAHFYVHDGMHDRGHMPAPRFEHRPPMPHGRYHSRDGRWNWSRDHWAWAPGIWIRF